MGSQTLHRPGQRQDPGGGGAAEGSDVAEPLHAIFDTPSLYARAWYASRGDLCAEFPSHVAAATACLHSVLHIFAYRGPLLDPVTHVLWCWDAQAKTVKPRKPKPQEYLDDREFVERVLTRLLGGANAHPADFESDDAVATAAYRLCERGCRSVVLSGDKDLQQIVGDKVQYYCLNKKSLLSTAHILERWGVKRPIQLSVALAIIGDVDDGVLGVRNWGPKKVQKAFERVTKEMPLGQVIDHVAAQLPRDQVDNFYSSLAVTLLKDDVENVPDPAPLELADPAVLDDMGLGHVRATYSRFRSAYLHHDEYEQALSDVDEQEV